MSDDKVVLFNYLKVFILMTQFQVSRLCSILSCLHPPTPFKENFISLLLTQKQIIYKSLELQIYLKVIVHQCNALKAIRWIILLLESDDSSKCDEVLLQILESVRVPHDHHGLQLATVWLDTETR